MARENRLHVDECRVTAQVRDRMGNNASGQTMLVIPDPAAQTDPDQNALVPLGGRNGALSDPGDFSTPGKNLRLNQTNRACTG